MHLKKAKNKIIFEECKCLHLIFGKIDHYYRILYNIFNNYYNSTEQNMWKIMKI